MNKKGFTLVELLSVIIIISVLLTIVGTSVVKVVKNAKGNLSATQINLIKSSAEIWTTSNIELMPDAGECIYLSLNNLKDYGLLDSDIIDPKNNKQFSNDIKIKISNILTDYGVETIKYEIGEDISKCSYPYICTAVTEENASYDEEDNLVGTISYKREDYNTIKYKPGDEYICEVKDNTYYHFYVLSTNNKNNEVITSESDDKKVASINLLLDNNVYYKNDNDTGILTSENSSSTNGVDLGEVSWVSREDYNDDLNYKVEESYNGNTNKGPITIFNYLHNATKDWNNIPNIIMNYIDEGKTLTTGYGKIETSNNITNIIMQDGTYVNDKEGNVLEYVNLKARIPMKIETENVGCTTNNYSCPLWIYNNKVFELSESYWILSSSINSYQAYEISNYNVSDNGIALNGKSAVYISQNKFVRPVITLPLKYIG